MNSNERLNVSKGDHITWMAPGGNIRRVRVYDATDAGGAYVLVNGTQTTLGGIDHKNSYCKLHVIKRADIINTYSTR